VRVCLCAHYLLGQVLRWLTKIVVPFSGARNRKMDRAKYVVVGAMKENRRSLPAYSLGVCTCFIAITVAAMMHSVLEQAPAIYLASAELEEGQVDVRVKPADGPSPVLFNFSRAEKRLEKFEEFKFAVPRFAIIGSIKAAGSAKATQVQLFAAGLEGEKKAGIGRGWDTKKFPPLGYGEAYLQDKVASLLGLGVGDTFQVGMGMFPLFRYFDRKPTRNTTDFFTRYGGDGFFSGCQNSGCKCESGSSDKESRCLLCDASVDSCGFRPDSTKISLTIRGLVRDWDGKVRNDVSNGLLVDYSHFFRSVWNSQPMYVRMNMLPELKKLFPKETFTDSTAHVVEGSEAFGKQFASEMIVMIPPKKRGQILIQDDYNFIQADMVNFTSAIVNTLGALDAIQYETPVVRQLRRNRFTSMYLALILDILVFILSVLSIVLIYSLLMINVESRTFEIAIRRMLGSTRRDVIVLLGAQALSYSVPALVIGMPVAAAGTTNFVNLLSSRLAGIPLQGGLTAGGVLYGLLLGLLIPIVASIGPIKTALEKRLVEALDTKRSVPGVKFTISRNMEGKVYRPFLVVGFCLTLFGFIVYYFLPLSLLSFNVGLLGRIFFFILLGLLFGLAFLSLNLEQAMEHAVMFVFFRCLVKKHLRVTTLKNLVAHRVRNLKTSMMYAISLSFIIMVNVFSNIQLQAYQFYLLQSRGGNMVVFGTRFVPGTLGKSLTFQDAQAFQTIIKNDSFVNSRIEGVAWASQPVLSVRGDAENTVGTQGRIFARGDVGVMAVSPNYFEIATPDFLKVKDDWAWSSKFLSGLSFGEQMYTARGTQSVILPSAYIKALNIGMGKNDPEPSPVEVMVNFPDESENSDGLSNKKRYRFLPNHMFHNIAGLRFSEYREGNLQVLVPLPVLKKFLGGVIPSIEDMLFQKLVLRLKPGLSEDEVDTIAKSLSGAVKDKSVQGSVFNYNDRLQQIESSVETIDMVFLGMTTVGMTLCFFSLLASMVSNIAEQTKDIAILRALGLRKSEIICISCLEAFILVIAASFLGGAAGWFVSWTISQQRQLITGTPATFYFPVELTFFIIFLAAFFALLSAGIPSRIYVQKYIADLMRM
jgi:ABC-type antimicrobial peptide transport system permease subunit